MSIRKERNGKGKRSITIIEDPDERIVQERDPVYERRADEAEGEEEYVSTARHEPWAMARGWLRTAQALAGFLLLLVETALTFRLAFALAAANRANGFVEFIYDVSGPFVAPFEGIAAERSVDGGVFEPETVIAMAVWLVLAIIIIALISVASTAPTPYREHAVTTRERHGHYTRRR